MRSFTKKSFSAGQFSLTRKVGNVRTSFYSPTQGPMPPNPFGEPADIHITLREFTFHSGKYFNIEMNKKALITGLNVQTSRTNYLKSFTIQTAKYGYLAREEEFVYLLNTDDTPMVTTMLPQHPINA